MEKPAWFDIERYKPSKDVHYWIDQLSRRNFAKQVVSNPNCKNPEDRFISIIFQNARIPGHFFEGRGSVHAMDYYDLVDIFRWSKSSLREKEDTHGEYESEEESSIRIAKELGMTKQETLRGIMERLSESNDPKERSDIDWTPLHHLADYPLSNLLLSIDLRLDTPTIVENVKELIESSRKDLLFLKGSAEVDGVETDDFKTTPVNQKTFADWYLYRVLPLFDLQLWAEIANQKLPRKEASVLLWPDGFGDAETIRKTSEPHLRRALASTTMTRLRTLVEEKEQ